MSRGGLVCTGMYFFRNFRLRVVILSELLIRTIYWLNWRILIIIFVLFRFVGYGFVWFWMRTWLLIVRVGVFWYVSIIFS